MTDGHERRTHGSQHHAQTRVRAPGGGADRRHLSASPPPAEPPVGREALRRLRGHRLGSRGLSHRPRGPALGARLGRRPRRDGVVPRAAAGDRARLGLHLVATKMKIGTQFENVLQRGLLEFAWTLPNGAPEFRYVYHEVIEEGQHSLMFQEFVNRTGFDVAGLGFWDRLGARRVIATARRFPALFFVFVLGGEDPIDHVQRTALRGGQPIHPLLRRIMQIHVTEEARHLCFARSYLRTEVPRLGAARRASLALQAPLVLGQMAQAMLRPSADVVRTHGIPAGVIAEAYTRNPRHRENTLAALAKLRDLCCEVGIVTPWSVRLWRAAGIWAE